MAIIIQNRIKMYKQKVLFRIAHLQKNKTSYLVFRNSVSFEHFLSDQTEKSCSIYIPTKFSKLETTT